MMKKVRVEGSVRILQDRGKSQRLEVEFPFEVGGVDGVEPLKFNHEKRMKKPKLI